MDIENMHPFCLPFSLCHDATSSANGADEGAKLVGDKLNNNNGKSNNNNNNNNNNSIERNRSKSKGALSPLEDIFDQLDANRLSPPSNRSLLQDESCLVESSDDHMDVGSSAFHALHLDIDMMATDEHDRTGDEDDDDVFDLCGHRDDDWFSASSAHDCLLFSPTVVGDSLTSGPAARHRKSHNSSLAGISPNPHHHHHHHHHNHQVFHVVDPIAIKSSPTLAQLNLNSNDDPTDGLWDTNRHNHHHHHNHHHTTASNSSATTNSSSILPCQAAHQLPTSMAHSSDLLPSCLEVAPQHTSSCHLANQASCNHQHHSTSQHMPMCHHHHMYHQHLHNQHHHNHPHNHHANRSQPGHAQSACLAVAPFRKNPDLYRNNNTGTPPACSSWCGAQKVVCSNGHETTNLVGPPRQQEGNDSQQSVAVVAAADPQKAAQQQARCASPAPLVTSSSSPLSSCGVQSHQMSDNNGNNKLKENIEYLTVLLCNGSNKLPDKQTGPQQQQQQQQQQQLPVHQQNQQQSISSTMAKSYSTLAQSLSTEPKLLHAQHQNGMVQTTGTFNHQLRPLSSPNIVAGNTQQQQQDVNIYCNTTWPHNEASSQMLNHHQQHQMQHVQQQQQQLHQGADIPMMVQQQQQQLDNQKRAVGGQWFKPNTVESSISAADSTAENQLPAPRCNGAFLPGGMNQTNGSLQAGHARQGGEMKVLSSLLNSETSARPTGDQFACGAWHGGPMLNSQHHPLSSGAYPPMNQPQQQQQQDNTKLLPTPVAEANSSIPPNGRPITLTPLMSNNVIIPQRHQTQSPKAAKPTKAPTFVQPASPSASSTTSSSGVGGTEPGTPTTGAKRQPKPAANSQTKSSDRSGRPNSLSTECSLSSHDEGFSSQVDQDDCMNSMRDDSDDESDVDSDDESFYGDYTNNDLIGASISDNPDCKWTLSMGRTRRNGQRRFFWQYNVQSKGPKGARVASADGSENPFVLPEASDPVFSNDCQIEGVKHSGKARRGDGNDLTPNPRKLLMIGLELKKLSKIINELAPVTDLPMNARNKTRKEKNKLASRACRLKKKAQHEANKIKLFGLQREHQQVVMAIYDIRKMLRESLDPAMAAPTAASNASGTVKTIVEQCSMSVAGKTSDFVNSVLEKVVSGFIDGGLQT